ncbi:hypothetical protein [Sphingomonas sp.]|uniref:hypothetical protein n=1 Tax=Sphingomonas sp. TaxID=28214 RepID=UPI002FD8EBB5
MIGSVALLLAIAQTASPSAAAPAAAPKVRCVRVEETGSLIRKKRICHTQGEWRLIERRDDTELNRMRDRTPINSQRPNG